tara:strand:+ start:185 stop:409 length:225 start_codon:yes stop_codon:yes gene_type:complete
MTNLALVPADKLDRLIATVERLEQYISAETGERWLSISDAAAHYEKDPDTIRRWIRTGQLKAKGAGTLRRVLVE